MAKNGLKWSRMVKNDQEWSRMVQNGLEWSKWSRMVPRGLYYFSKFEFSIKPDLRGLSFS